jgi:hypothetical protein
MFRVYAAPQRHGHHDFGACSAQSFQTADIFLTYVNVPHFCKRMVLISLSGVPLCVAGEGGAVVY